MNFLQLEKIKTQEIVAKDPGVLPRSGFYFKWKDYKMRLGLVFLPYFKMSLPDFIAAKRGPSCHSKHIELFPSEGKSLPIKSLISVCSDKLIRTNVFPVNEANAVKVNYFKKRFFLISNYTNISNNSNFPPILFEMTFSLKNDNLEKILKLQVLS